MQSSAVPTSIPDIQNNARNQVLQQQVQRAVGAPLIEGNSVTYLHDADFFRALTMDVRNSKDFIDGVTFVWGKGKVSSDLTRELADAGRRGVKVSWLIDGIGGAKRDNSDTKRVKSGGGDFRVYRPLAKSRSVMPYKSAPALFPPSHSANYRTHRKIIVMNTVDGPVAYVYGHGFSFKWTDGEGGGPPRKDFAVRITGPAVKEIHKGFLSEWDVARGDTQRPDLHCPPTGNVAMQVVNSTGRGGPKNSGHKATGWPATEAGLTTGLMTINAQKELLFASPYFSPPTELIDYMTQAARNGVSVKMILNGERVDKRFAQLAGEVNFQRLLESGVQIGLYDKGMFHSKMAVVDRRAVRIGSSNWNMRSMQMDNENDVILYDQKTVDEAAKTFDDYWSECRKLTPENWAQRSTSQKLAETVMDMSVGHML